MRRFKEGDVLTLEDVKTVFAECKVGKRTPLNEGVQPIIKNGVAFFDSIEDVEKYYGEEIMTVEEYFK